MKAYPRIAVRHWNLEAIGKAKQERRREAEETKRRGAPPPPAIKTTEELKAEDDKKARLELKFEIARQQATDPNAFPPTAFDPGINSMFVGVRAANEEV